MAALGGINYSGAANLPEPYVEPDLGYGGNESQIARGIRSALYGAKAGVQAFGGVTADALGANNIANALYGYADASSGQAQANAPRVQTIRQINEGGNKIGDMVDYAAGHFGSALPYIAGGVALSSVGRGVGALAAARTGLRGAEAAAAAETAGAVAGTAGFFPVMSGDTALQMRHDSAADGMGVGERAIRSYLTGGVQAFAQNVVPNMMAGRAVTRAAPAGVAGMAGEVAKTVGIEGLSEAAEDVVGQANKLSYDPNARYNLEQTGEAFAAGAVGGAPMIGAHGLVAHGLDNASGLAVDTGRVAGRGAVAGIEELTNAAKALGGAAYDTLPAPAQEALKAVAAAGTMTADAAAILYPHAEKLGADVGRIVKEFYADNKADVERYMDDASVHAGPSAEDVLVNAHFNIETASEGVKEAARQTIADIAADPALANIADPVRKHIQKAKNDLDGLSNIASIMTDPAKWAKESITPKQLQTLRRTMTTPAAQAKYAGAVEALMKEVPMDSPAATEVRELVARVRRGDVLNDNDAARMYSQFLLAGTAHKTTTDLLHMLNFDQRLKAGQAATKTAVPDQFSRQKTKEKTAIEMAFEAASQTRSESFRNTIDGHIREMLNTTPEGKEILAGSGADKLVAGFVDFMSKAAEGLSGYDTKAVRNMATYIKSKFDKKGSKAGSAAIDAIIDAADFEFGSEVHGEKARNIAALRDDMTSMHTDAAAIRALMRDGDASVEADAAGRKDSERYSTIERMVKDVEFVVDTNANREKYQGVIGKARAQADELRKSAKTAEDIERAFKLRETAMKAERELEQGGLDGLKEKWVEDGLVDAKNFNRMVEAVQKYAKHPERLTTAERRKGDHATEANYAAEDLDSPEAKQRLAEQADEDAAARPGKDRTEAEEIEDARNLEKGVQGDEDRKPPIWFGTNAFDAGTHNPHKIGAPLTRHPSGDYAHGDAPGNQLNAAIAEAHAKFGHRVTRAHSVKPLAWAEEMAATEGHKSDYGYLDDAMQALLKEDQRRLASGKLSATDKYWVEERAKLAEAELAEQAKRGGIERYPAAGHFFNNKINRHYRYYRMEQHDAANLSYNTQQLKAAYSVREGENEGAYVARMRTRDRDAFAKEVYEKSLISLVDASGNTIRTDVARLVTDAMIHHQAGDITGAGEKGVEPNIKKEILTAFHNVMAALMDAEGLHPVDPLGKLSGYDTVVTSGARTTSRTDRLGDPTAHLNPDTVVFRDPTGRVKQALGEEVSSHSVRNFFTVGDLMAVKGVGKVDPTKNLLKLGGVDLEQKPVSPGRFSQADIDSFLIPIRKSRHENERDEVTRDAGAERGRLHRGLELEGSSKQYTVDVRGLLGRMLERNGIEPYEALSEGKLPQHDAAVFMREALQELKAMGFKGDLFDLALGNKTDSVVLYRQTFGDESYPVTLGKLKPLIGSPDLKSTRNLRDAQSQELLRVLAKVERIERESKLRTRNGEATDSDNSPGSDRVRAEAVDKALANTEFSKGQPEKYESREVIHAMKGGDPVAPTSIPLVREKGADPRFLTKEAPDAALKYSPSEIDNFRISGLLRDLGEAAHGDTPAFDRAANQLFRDTADAIDMARTGKGDKTSLPARLELVRELLEAQAPVREGERPVPRLRGTLRVRAEGKAKGLEARIKEMAVQAEQAREKSGLKDKILDATKDTPEAQELIRDTWDMNEKQLGEYQATKSALRMETARAQNDAGSVAVTPGESVRPLDTAVQRENATLKSKDVVTNEPNLLAAAKAQHEERAAAVEKAKAATAEDNRRRLSAVAERQRLKQVAAEERAAAEAAKPVKPAEAAPFDVQAEITRFATEQAKTGGETNKTVNAMSDADLATFLTALPAYKKTKALSLANQAHNILGQGKSPGQKAWAEAQLKRAGVTYDAKNGRFWAEGETPFSRQKTGGTVDMFPEDTAKALQGELTRLLKDAFDLHLPDTLGKDISGTIKDRLISVSKEASDMQGTLHHEVWHGVEKLLGEMGENGKAVLEQIYKHTSTPEMVKWLHEQYGDEGVTGQLGDKAERAAFAFQKFMAGDKMPPLDPATRSVWEKLRGLITRLATKLGFETTTAEERTNNFFDYVKRGDFARDMENAPEVRRGMGEKNGDHLMATAAKHLKPFVEAYSAVMEHSDTRVRALDIPEYTAALNLYAGVSGKGGYHTRYVSAQNKLTARLTALTKGMDAAKLQDFMSSKEYRGFKGEVEAYMKGAKLDDKDIHALNNKLDSFNTDLIERNIDGFINDLVHHSGFAKKPDMARKIANQIIDTGYFMGKGTRLFEGRDDIRRKWESRDAKDRMTRYIERAVFMAEQNRAFGDNDGIRGKLDKLLEAGHAKATPEGRKLMENYVDAMEGRLGEGSLSPAMKKLMGTLLFANNVTILPLAVFSQMLDPMNMAMRRNSLAGSLDALFRGITDLPRSFDKLDKLYTPDKWEELAMQVGTAPGRIVTNAMSNLMNGMQVRGKIGEMNEAFFKYNFMDQWNRSMHIEATKHAVEFIKEHADNSAKKQGSKDIEGGLQSERFLKELGLTHEHVKLNEAGELVLTDKVEAAIVQYVEEAMAHPDAGSNPMWMNDPRFALLSQMKRFTFAHSKFVLDRGMSEVQHGNIKPLLPMLVAMPWMMAADGLRDVVTGSAGYQSTGALDTVKHLAERAGHLGKGQFVADIEGAISRGESPVEALGGPTVEMFGAFARGLHNGNLIDEMLGSTPGGKLIL